METTDHSALEYMESSRSEDRKEEKKPAWSDLKTKAGKERKRLPLACIACRRKKIRCSGEKPACKHCLRSRTPCVYKVTARKAAPRTDYMTMLDKRLRRMEERVIRIIPEPEPFKMASIGRASVKPPAIPAPKSAGSKKRAAGEAFGADIEQWAQNDNKRVLPQHSAAIEHGDNRLLTDGAEHLPDQKIQEHLAETFFDNCYGQAYYLLHKASFMRRLKTNTVPPVLMLAICAVAVRFSTYPGLATDPPFLRGEQWAKPAREIALKRYDEPNITILIVLIILGLHEFGTCQGGRSWMLGGMAVRMAASLQLHRELDHDPSMRKRDPAAMLNVTDREIRRRAMWSCFIMDRFISSGTDRPMLLDEKTIEVRLPIEESRFQMELPGVTEQLDMREADETLVTAASRDNMGVAAYSTRTIALWGRVVRYFNLGGRKRDPHPMWHPDSEFSCLQRQAGELQESFPERLKYTPENLRTHAAQSLGGQFLLLHISFQEILLFLHIFAIPTRPNTNPARNMPKDFLQKAGRAAIEAAGAISELLDEAPSHRLMAPFAGYCAFLSSTVHVWVIFSNNVSREAASKRCLAINVKYLSHIKRFWGVLYHMSENLRLIYRQFADAPSSSQSKADSGSTSPDHRVLNYGGWFNEYPHGVSQSDYQEPARAEGGQEGDDAALSQKSDLQTVKAFFETPTTPPTEAPTQPKSRKSGTGSTPANSPVTTARRTQPRLQNDTAQSRQQEAQQLHPQAESPAQASQASLYPSDVKQETPWTNMAASPIQGTYANMPHSVFGFSSIAQQSQHAQFQRPIHPPNVSAQSRLTTRQQQQQQQRSRAHNTLFDSQTSHPHLNNTNLDGFGGTGGSGQIPLYTPSTTFPGTPTHPHSATVASFPESTFYDNGAGEPASMQMSIHDIDRRIVYDAYATDPGVQSNPWDGGISSGDFSMSAHGVTTGEQADMGLAPSGEAGAATGTTPATSLANDAATSAWFVPFNLDVIPDAFGGDFGLDDVVLDPNARCPEGMEDGT